MKSLQRHHIQQSAKGDGGLACLQAVLKYFGAEVPIHLLRRSNEKKAEQINLLGILQTGRALGLNGKGYRADLKFLQSCKTPCVLHIIKQQTTSTFVVFYSYDPQTRRYWIGDPEHRRIKAYGEEQLLQAWISKCLVSFKATDTLQTAKVTKSSPWFWLKELIRPDLNLLSLVFALGILLSVLGLAMAIFSQQLIDHFLTSRDKTFLWISMGCLPLLLLLRSGLEYVRQFLLLRQSKDFFGRLNNYFYTAMLEMPGSFFAGFGAREIVERLNTPNRIQEKLTGLMSDGLLYGPLILLATATLFYFSWPVGLIVLACGCCFGVIVLLLDRKIIPSSKSQLETYLKLQSAYTESIQNQDLIRLWNKQSVFSKITKYLYDDQYQRSVFEWKIAARRYTWYVEIIAILLAGLILLVASGQVVGGHLSLGAIVAIVQLLAMCAVAVKALAGAGMTLSEARATFECLQECNSIARAYQLEADSKKINLEGFESLVIENLAFGFSGSGQALKDVTLRLQRGELVVLNGISGSGKSSLLQLIQKDYSPTSGSIEINGIDLHQLSTSAWSNHLGIMPQQMKFFKGSLLDNILMGEENADRKKLENFLADYGLDPYFKSLPNGYETTFENHGASISRAQKQLICVARALWKKPGLLLLDEPTAGMDRKMKQFFIQLLKKANPQMGILLATKQRSLIKLADRSYTLKNGRTERYAEKYAAPVAADQLVTWKT